MAGDDTEKKPPTFMADISQWVQYKRNLGRWSRCTSVAKKLQGEIVLLNIPDTHKLKERLELEVADTVTDNEAGLELIIKHFDAIYGSDEVQESFNAYRDLEVKQRSVGQDMTEYVDEWEILYLSLIHI